MQRAENEIEGRGYANEQALRWEVEQRRKAAEAREQNRVKWHDYHRHLQEHHARLADEHREKADRLIPTR